MTYFDLTFKGTILPDHDPQQVKTRFAELFSIKDPFVLEQLFSGDTFVVRSNLDRKTAADFFRKVVDLGGQAELVATSANAEQAKAETIDEQSQIAPVAANAGRDGQILARRNGEVDQSWAVSSALGGGAGPTLSVVSGSNSDDPEDIERAAQEEQLRKELTDLRLARDNAERQAADELSRLDEAVRDTQEKFQEEQTRVRAMREQAAEKGAKALAQLQLKEENTRHYAAEQQQQLEEEQRQKADDGEQALQELNEEIVSTESRLHDEIAAIEQNKQDTSARAEEAIAKLEQLIEETRQQMEADLAELDTLSAAARETLETGGLEFNQRREEILYQAAEDSDASRAQLEEVQLKTEEHLAELADALQEEEQRVEEAVSQLEEMEGEVEQRWGEAIGELQHQITATQRELEQQLEQLAAEEANQRHKLNTIHG